jgi:DNA-binding CsgD family transcriptional regulator
LAGCALKSGKGQSLSVADEFSIEVSYAADIKHRGIRARGLLASIRGDGSEALKLYKQLEHFEIVGTALDQQRLLGLLMRTAGRYDRAILHLRDSLNQSRKENLVLYIGWDSFFLAETLRMRDGKGDAQEAHELLDQALDLSREHRMVLLQQRIEASRPVKTNAHFPDGLTNREVEVLCLVARGMTNKEIGYELFVSVKTVNNHVTNILEKIGAANRAEASVYAARHGLTEA